MGLHPIRTTRDLGLEIRRGRARVGLTQEQLAARARVSRPWLSELERGKQTAEVGLVLAVLEALDLAMTFTPAPVASGPVDLDSLP